MRRIGDFKGVGHFEAKFYVKGDMQRFFTELRKK